MFESKPRQHRTTTTIDMDDWNFMKDKNIKVSHAVRSFVGERRLIDSGQYKETIENLRRARDKQVGLRDNLLKALREVISKEQFDELMQKI